MAHHVPPGQRGPRSVHQRERVGACKPAARILDGVPRLRRAGQLRRHVRPGRRAAVPRPARRRVPRVLRSRPVVRQGARAWRRCRRSSSSASTAPSGRGRGMEPAAWRDVAESIAETTAWSVPSIPSARATRARSTAHPPSAEPTWPSRRVRSPSVAARRPARSSRRPRRRWPRRARRPGATRVLVAPPGAGKTTVVAARPARRAVARPAADRRCSNRAACATRAAARRMADADSAVGRRHSSATRPATSATSGRDTRIEVVTEGVLTRRLQHDPELPGVGARRCSTRSTSATCRPTSAWRWPSTRPRTMRPDLRILAMSATPGHDAAGCRASLAPDDGRTVVDAATAALHPVDVRWAPARHATSAIEQAVADVVRAALREESRRRARVPARHRRDPPRRAAAGRRRCRPTSTSHPLAGALSLGRAGPRAGAVAARSTARRAVDRHRRDVADRGRRARRRRRRAGPRAALRPAHRDDPADDGADQPRLGRPARRARRAHRAGRRLPPVEQDRARQPAEPTARPRSPRSTWPGSCSSWPRGGRRWASWRSSTRRRPARRGAGRASCSPTLGALDARRRRHRQVGRRMLDAAGPPAPRRGWSSRERSSARRASIAALRRRARHAARPSRRPPGRPRPARRRRRRTRRPRTPPTGAPCDRRPRTRRRPRPPCRDRASMSIASTPTAPAPRCCSRIPIGSPARRRSRPVPAALRRGGVAAGATTRWRHEAFVVAADLDGRRDRSRIRLAPHSTPTRWRGELADQVERDGQNRVGRRA